MHKVYRRISIFIVLIIMAVAMSLTLFASVPLVNLTRGGQTVFHYNTTTPVTIPESYQESDTEFRAVWVATVYNLNIATHTSETQYKAAYQQLIADVKAKNMNAILFQVRPNNDAFYDSDYAPWSRWLAGSEGNDPGWDVMQYLVDYAHSQGIQFHAWMNPYRVQNTALSKEAMLSSLHNENFAKLNPDLVIAGNYSNSVYPYILNPGEPAVKTYIRNVVKELMDLYDVDGIHFDDYFYPYSGLSSDTQTYDTYKLPGQAIADWRRENVNDVIRGVMEDVTEHNILHGKDIRFGVSPFGIWQSQGEGSNTFTGTSESYHDQYADSKRWVEEGWLHYICPQVYWSFQHATAPYADVVDWWASVVRGTGVDLIIGHGIHHTEWATDEIQTQLRYNQKHPEIKGSALYSKSYLSSAQMNLVKDTYWTTTPLNYWAESAVAAPTVSLTGTLDGSVYRSDVTATLQSDDTMYYRINNGEWILYENPIVFTEEGTHTLHVKAVTTELTESLVEGYTIVIDKINSDVPVITINGDMIGTAYLVGSTVTLTSNGAPIWVAINHGNVGEWQLYTGPIVLDDTGNYYIRTKTINNENVESIEVNRLISVTAPCYSAPEIDILGTGNPPYYRDVTVSINGETDILVRINDGSWTAYTDTLTFSTDGTYVISYKNNDACGTVYQETIYLDQTNPTEPTIDIVGAYDGKFYTEEVLVTLSKIDEDDEIYYRLHNGKTWSSWAIYTESLELTKSVNYTLEFYAIDLAGNVSDTMSNLIRLNIPPDEHSLYVERDGEYITYYNTTTPVELVTDYVEKEAEVRAAWVATVGNIDIGLHTSEATYKATIITMLDRLEELHFNTIFFQVRPMNDAFYPSDYAPFSRYLTGTEGVDPGWDVFEFIIHEAHIRGIEVHAWLNPYRVSNISGDKSEQLEALHEDNFAKQHPEYVLQDLSGKLILNPGEAEVRNYIKNVIDEIMTNYDVDGIHFDDYFYSYNGMDNAQDAQTYEETKLTDQSLADWRRENVNVLVRDIFEMVEAHNTEESTTVKFGISPFGIWKSGGTDGSNTSTSTMQSYSAQYADTKKWVEEGWLHYIMPQLYWPFDHSLAPYADLVDWWAELCEANDVDLIIGHGFYRYAETNGWTYESEFLEQLRYNQHYDIIKGSALFSYKTLNLSNALVTGALDRLETHYWTDYVTFPWASDVAPYEPLVCLPNQTEVNGVCVDNPPTCEDDEEWNGSACIPIIIPEEPVEPENNTVVTIAIIGGSVSGLAVVVYLVRKFVLKI